MGGGAAGGGDCEGDFNVVRADVGHGFGEPCAVDCERLVHQGIEKGIQETPLGSTGELARGYRRIAW